MLRVAMLGQLHGLCSFKRVPSSQSLFSLPYRLELRVVCGRNRAALEAMAPRGYGLALRDLANWHRRRRAAEESAAARRRIALGEMQASAGESNRGR